MKIKDQQKQKPSKAGKAETLPRKHQNELFPSHCTLKVNSNHLMVRGLHVWTQALHTSKINRPSAASDLEKYKQILFNV